MKGIHKGIQCKQCGRVSWNKNDVKHRFCGNCHVFLEEAQYEILESHDPWRDERGTRKRV